MSHPAYRSDIQVLRGIAVLLVVLYHLACPFLPGGFVGVDIFFVISGFLMASALQTLNRSSILSYYGRRVRRILPAYITAIFVTAIAAAILVLPFELRQYTDKMFYYITALPNLSFWSDNSYFESASFRPGLHFWSLGVELQFYLILPLIVFFHRKNRLFTVLFLVLSLAACVAMSQISAKTAFYLTPFRVWEFLAGFLVAGLRPRHIPAFAPVFLMIGLISIAFIKIPVLHFPGFYAIPPVFLAAALIYTGFSQFEKGVLAPVYKFLERTGEYSYSIYLVHFPVIVFLFYVPFHPYVPAEFYSFSAILALVLTAVLSILLYRFVEQPFRKKGTGRGKVLYLLIGVLVGSIFTFYCLPRLSSSNFSESEQKIFSAVFDRDQYRCGKLKRLNPYTESCLLTQGSADKARVLMVGNSYLGAIKSILVDEARKADITARLMTQNCQLGKSPCTIDAVVKEAKRTQTTHVLLHASPNSMKLDDIKMLVAFGRKYGFSVILIDPTPSWKASVPESLFMQERDRNFIIEKQNVNDYRTINRDLFEGLQFFNDTNFRRYKIEKSFCVPQCRMKNDDGYPLYFDSGHLTLKGSEFVRPAVNKAFADIGTGK